MGEPMQIQSGATVLFQGDSITDCGRAREGAPPGSVAALGRGYAAMAGAVILRDYAGAGVRVLNRGVSGNRVVDLYARWKIDALNLEPDLLSILIGVNDTWHRFKRNNGVEPERYERFYRMLLDWTRERNPEVRLVLCEPFALRCGEVTDEWIGEMDHRRRIVRTLAEDYDAIFVPFQGAFEERLGKTEPQYWAADGVHPTAAGHALMARTWLEGVGLGA